MNETFELQGRRWHAQQIQELGQWVSQNPTWSRYRLSRELCTRWSWIRPNGQLADMAARSFLNKLHARALIQLLFRFTMFWEKISVIIGKQRPVVIKMIWEDLDRDSVRSRSEREGVIADYFVDGGQAVCGRARKPERNRSWWGFQKGRFGSR